MDSVELEVSPCILEVKGHKTMFFTYLAIVYAYDQISKLEGAQQRANSCPSYSNPCIAGLLLPPAVTSQGINGISRPVGTSCWQWL